MVFQSAVVTSQEGILKRVMELRGALVEELKGIQRKVESKASLEADDVVRRANVSAEELLALAKVQADEHTDRIKSEAQQFLTQAHIEAAEVSSRAKAEADEVLGRVNQEVSEILSRASAEADDVVVRANTESDVIIARATTVAAEKILAKRTASHSLVGKSVTSDRLLNEKEGSGSSSSILSPREKTLPSEQPAALPAIDLAALANRLASTEASAEPGPVVDPAISLGGVSGPASRPELPSEPPAQAQPMIEVPMETPASLPVTPGADFISGPAPVVFVTPLSKSPEQASSTVVVKQLAEAPAPVVAQQPVLDSPVVVDASAKVLPILETPMVPESPVPSGEIPPTPVTEPSAPFVLPPLPGETVKLQALVGDKNSEEASAEPILATASMAPAAGPVASPFAESATDVAVVGKLSVVEEVFEAAPTERSSTEIPPMAAELSMAPVSSESGAAPVANGGPFSAVVVEAKPVPVGATPAAEAVSSTSALQRSDLLGIVSAKTGFPIEMLVEYLSYGTKLDLTPQKVVEIIGAVQNAFPGAPEVSLTRIPEFLDLGRLVGFLVGSSASFEPTALELGATVEGEESIPAANSPFQVAAEASTAPAVDPDGSPFQAMESVAAVPPSPFAMAVESNGFFGLCRGNHC